MKNPQELLTVSEKIVKTLKEEIKAERKRKNMSTEEVAEIINMTPGLYGLCEVNQRDMSTENLFALAIYFDIPIDTIINQNT